MGKVFLITLFSIFLISACAQPSRLDKDYGQSVRQFQSNQVLDPDAGKNLDPVTGLDGEASRGSIEKYRESFKMSKETPQPLMQTGTQADKGKE